MKYRRSDAEDIAREMDKMAGGHCFAAKRTAQTDGDGYWLYYIEQVFLCPACPKISDMEKLERQAVENIENRKRAMAALGSIRTAKKAAASRANGKKGGRPRKSRQI